MLEWFTTIPGILVICGVILLVIAIILFAVSAKKDKKENTINEPINNEIEQNNIEVNNTIPEVQPMENVIPTNVEEPQVEVPAEPTVEQVVEPTVEFEINDIPAVVEEPITPEVVNIQDEEVVGMPGMQTMNIEVNEPTVVYGGEQPVVDFTQEEKPVTIYGGNDPLEATQNLPQVEETHMPYGGGYPEINIPEIVSEPVVEPVSPMPTVDFNTISQPEVVNIPDMATEPVVEPVIQPVQPIIEEKTIPVVEEL